MNYGRDIKIWPHFLHELHMGTLRSMRHERFREFEQLVGKEHKPSDFWGDSKQY